MTQLTLWKQNNSKRYFNIYHGILKSLKLILASVILSKTIKRFQIVGIGKYISSNNPIFFLQIQNNNLKNGYKFNSCGTILGLHVSVTKQSPVMGVDIHNN